MIQIELATKCNKNEQQQDGKNNWIIEQMDKDDLKDIWRDNERGPKQVYQGLTGC
jgi:hypothetical protein